MISTIASTIIAAGSMAGLLLLTAAAQRHGATDPQLFFMLAVACAVPAYMAPGIAIDLYADTYGLMAYAVSFAVMMLSCKGLYPCARVTIDARWPVDEQSPEQPSQTSKRRQYGWGTSPLPATYA
jgi:hypothetical protein